jgi:2-keto-3-deoxy-L-rhamnonate aldolase RhmA/quercetin dioxygenase-like cupin family protein
MKPAALKEFRRKLASNEAVVGLWVTLESPSITEMGVALGVDWIVIDAEHGHLDWKEIVEHVRAGVRSNTVILVRVAELNAGLIKRALDIGADGILIPWMESAEQVQQAVAFAQYPPDGVRGIGAERATAWGQCFAEHAAEANQGILVVPIIETVKARQNLASMLAVEGVDTFFIGPADYSASAGYRGQWEGIGVAEQLLEIKDAIRAAGKHCGLMATNPENLQQRKSQGFSMLGLGSDTGLLLRSLHEALGVVGRDRKLSADLSIAPAPTAQLGTLTCPPESMRPDRPEVINERGQGQRVQIAPGVVFECLVGTHNKARNLTTGIVTFEKRAVLPFHRHTFAESITLLKGEAEVCAEGRMYHLTELDNVTLPIGVAHQVRNLGDQPAVFHIAMNTDTPSRKLVDQFFSRRPMPLDSTGLPGAERVTRFKTAHRFEAGPNTQFIDFFNHDLIPGIQMSGGYGLFSPRGRLPAHYHDFDESICITEGTATCVVEGRRHQMKDLSTALQPRGRVHYFINESPGMMSMIWVYAGPMPERIVVDEGCATPEGNPWR